MNAVLKQAIEEPFEVTEFEKGAELLGLPALPVCPICKSELFFFWNGNGYCSETYSTMVRVKDGKCTSTGGVPVVKVPSKHIKVMFGERPKGYYKHANKILINIHMKSCGSR